MTEAQILDLAQGYLWHFALVFVRIGAFVSLMPGFGERTVPVRIKLGLAIAFSMIVAPAVPVTANPGTLIDLTLAILQETGLGLLLGVGVRLFVLALQTAGSIAAQSTSLSQILGGAAVEPVPAMGFILVISGLALAMATGLHVKAAVLLISSYQLFPSGALPDAQEVSRWGVGRVSRAFSLAFMLAAPFVITSVIYNLALGAINRAMPQLMVAFVGAPAITFGGLAILFMAAPLMLSVWLEALWGFMADPGGAPQ